MQKSKGFEWSYRDLLTALVVVYMAMAALALIAASKATTQAVNPGSVMFQMTWDKGAKADVDLWVQAPGDQPVGYSHPAGPHCNLLRDDLGPPVDPESRNMELTVCRGTPDGEWIANVAFYANRGAKLPVAATIKAIKGGPNGAEELVKRTVTLVHEGEELTVFRFTTRDKTLVTDSINHLPMALWRGS